MGSKKSSNASTTSNTYQADNRVVAGDGAIALATGANYRDSSRTTTTITGTDPGAVQFAELAAELASNVVGAQSDATKFMAQSGAQLLRDMGESVTDMYATAGQNNTESWGQTVARADDLFQSTAAKANERWSDTVGASTAILGDTAQAAGRLADLAVTAYQPADAKAADTLKWGLIAAAALAALIVFPKIIK